ncbi:cupredoxin domain-containing protein [Neobacillus mesonae]|uniref:cupredoxin domain-containing protein n=1 Tax=Neobacillus mesonae TaxID=1193713 RepID=UPI00203E7CAA|nr:cupredoxin domain-containing protein [Neobacillus mesonae]MCM3571127.1 cupredoxin domain-containing protein [Neobacillus mesonae]
MIKKKRSVLLGLLLSSALIVGACSSQETSSTAKKTANTEAKEAKSNLLMVSGDTVSEQGGCVLASRFAAGDKIVFRMNATDPNSNKQVEGAKLKLHLSTGEELDMKYGEHPPGGDVKFWTVAYPVTEKTPTGTLEYYVTAEDGNRKGEFRPFNVAPSLLTIVDSKAKGAQAQPQEEKKEEAKAADTANIKTNQNVDIVASNFKFNEDKYYVKARQEVTLKLTSKEGSHGVMIEGLNVSLNKPNGTVKFTPDKPGEYKIHCSVFCGSGHGEMTAALVVVE